MKLRIAIVAAWMLGAATLHAQPQGTSKPGEHRSELRLQYYFFDNFFQSSDPSQQGDVNALGAEYRFAWRPSASLQPYVHVNYLKYDEDGLSDGYGARAGAVWERGAHEVNAFLERQQNRPSFETDETFGVADRAALSADYAYRLQNWQFGAEADHEWLSYETDERNNTFDGVGASVRYRGFGRAFVPRVGFRTGERDVNTSSESYDQDEWYLQADSNPRPWLYFSVRYLNRERDYSTRVRTSSNFGRVDDRDQWSLTADVKQSPRLSWLLYAAREDVDSSRTGRDFDSAIVMVGPVIHF